MFDDLTKEIKAQLYDRARSPLFGTFAAAWIGWNIPAIAVFFSSLSIDNKVTFWGNYFADSSLSHGLLYPLSSSLLFLLLYPFPARWMFHYWNWQHIKLKEIQRQLEDKTPLTQEEANALRKALMEQQIQSQQQLSSLTVANRESDNQRNALLERLAKFSSDADKSAGGFQEKLRAIQNENNQLRQRVAELGLLKSAQGPSSIKIENKPIDATTAVPGNVLSELRTKGWSDLQVAIFATLVKNSGSSDKKDTARSGKWNKIEFEHAVARLTEIGIVTREYGDEGAELLQLTPAGLELAVATKLTKFFDELEKKTA